MVEMELIGVRVELPTNAPIVLLRETDGAHRTLPIFIGGPEATAWTTAHSRHAGAPGRTFPSLQRTTARAWICQRRVRSWPGSRTRSLDARRFKALRNYT